MDPELKKRMGEWQKSGVLAAVDKVVAAYGLRTLESFVASLEPRDAQTVVNAVQKQLDAKKTPDEAARIALKEVTGRDAASFKAIIDDGYQKYVKVLEQVVREFGLSGDDTFWKDFAAKVQKRQDQNPSESFEQAARATAAAFKK